MSILGNNRRRAITSLIAGVFVATLGAPGAWAQTPPPEDQCLAALVVIPGNTISGETFNFDATNSPDDPDPSCTMGPGFGSVFLEFTATATSARIRTDLGSFGPDANFAVYAVDQIYQCDTSLWAEVGCSEDNAVTLERNTNTCIEGLFVGETYKIVLKSFTAASSGDYTLQIDGPCTSGIPAVCGDGYIDDGEQCDDSNSTGGDGCSAICEIEGGPPAVCGDGVIEGGEQCDDGNVTSGDGCSAICQIEGDITPPVVTAPADVTEEATGPQTTVAIGMATATDDVGVTVIASNAPATFPVGLTVVTWSATDAASNTGNDTQNVTVEDTTAPVIILSIPTPDPVIATGPETVVNIGTATATDLVDGPVAVTNDAPAAFPPGTTKVTWTATDTAVPPNVGTATQYVTVLYIFGQFLPPLEDGKIYKANRTIPVKFQITFVGGEPVEEAVVGIQVVMIGEGGEAGDSIDLSTNETADTGTVFRFTDGQYIYNLSTQGFAPGIYRITAVLSDGQTEYIDIELR